MTTTTLKNAAASFIKITLFSLAVIAGLGMIANAMPVLGMGAIVVGCNVLTCGEDD